ncbi:MAG: DUF4365 domain-containing protein [Spirochaetota bacterium]
MNINNQIIERIGVHKTALIFLKGFNWIEREQPISDYGIDMQVEIVENGDPTGLLIALQIKSGQSYLEEQKGKYIVYRGESKHLDYWTSHSLPVIIIIYDDKKYIIYWEFVNKNTVELTEKAWKIKIPTDNKLDKISKAKLREYYFSDSNFLTLSTSDTSYANCRRLDYKILVKNKPSKSIIKDFIQRIIERLKKDNYYRNEIPEKALSEKESDCIWLLFYSNILQFKNGLPFCRVAWNRKDIEFPVKLDSGEKLDPETEMEWDSQTTIPDEFLEERFTKGTYLSLIKLFTDEVKKIHNKLLNLYTQYKAKKIDIHTLTKKILLCEEEFQLLLPDELSEKHPPFECIDVNQKIIEVEALIGNIFTITNDNRDEQNKSYLINRYIEYSKEHIVKIRTKILF